MAAALNPFDRSDGLKVVDVVSATSSAAAIMSNGGVVFWGLHIHAAGTTTTAGANQGAWPDANGNGIPNALEPSLTGRTVLKGHASFNAMVFEMSDGTLFTAGSNFMEGLPIANTSSDIYSSFGTGDLESRFPDILNPAKGGVKYKRVFANAASFAILRQDNSVVAWGKKESGGAPLANGLVGTGSGAYLGLGDSAGVAGANEVADPLDPATNGGLPIVDIVGGGSCYLAIRSNGSVVTWGRVSSCGDATGVSPESDSVHLSDSNENGVADLLEAI